MKRLPDNTFPRSEIIVAIIYNYYMILKTKEEIAMKKIVLAVSISIIISSFLYLFSVSHAADARPAEIKKSDKCPVCGMFVSGYKNWISQIVYKEGTYAAFDGPKDMFRYYLNPGKYAPTKKQSDIAAVFVTEYYSTKMMDARGLFFIKGSDVSGPMGSELVPVESADKAKEFMRDHGGKKILKFGEVTMEDLR